MATEAPTIATGVSDDDSPRLGKLDLVVIVIYFVVVLGVGIWSSYRSRSGVTGYFLASRNMHWIPVGASIFASNIGSEHFIGLAGSGAAKGIGVICYEQSAVYILMLLGWIFVPVYMSSGVYTMPEYLRMRFGGQRIRVYISVLSLILYIFTKISADLYAGAIFIQMGFNKSSSEWLYISVLIILAAAAVFAIAGGLSAVMWTDFVQTILMVVGSIYLAIKAFDAVGGFNELVRKFPMARASIAAHNANNERCAEPPGDYMHLFRSPIPGESDLPWTGIVFGFYISAIWHWCSDQVIVQRALAARNLSHAKAGTVFTSYLKFLPLWVIVFPGMASRILYPDRVGCAHPDECEKICGIRGGCSNIAFTEIALNLLPPGLSGLMLAVVLAALVSSLTSVFNSASTVFTIDVWQRFRKQSSEKELVLVGRLFVVILVIGSVLWIPFIQNSKGSQLFEYVQSIGSFLNAPITAVFLLAFFWKRTNEQGAFCGLMVGLAIGMIRFVLEFSFVDPPCGDDPIQKPPGYEMMVSNIHFLHFRMMLFVITIIITVVVSLLTRPIPEECLHRLTFWTRHSTKVRLTMEEARRNAECPGGDLSERKEITLTEENDEQEDEVTKTRTEREEEAFQAAQTIKEDPRVRIFVGVNAVICLCFATFVFGFFA